MSYVTMKEALNIREMYIVSELLMHNFIPLSSKVLGSMCV